MTRIEDGLAAMAQELTREAAQVDVEAALDEVARPRRTLFGAAAAAVVVALIAGGAVLLADDDESHVIADGGPDRSSQVSTTSAPTAPERPGVAFEVLFQGSTSVMVDTLSYAGTATAFSDHWQAAGLHGSPPTVDFDEHLVLSITRTSCGEPLVALELVGDRLIPRFGRDRRCGAAGVDSLTHVVAVERAGLPGAFHLVLPAAADGGRTDVELRVDLLASASAVKTPGSSLPAAEGPDLLPSEPGAEITFDGVAQWRLGQVLAVGDVSQHGATSCGYWPGGEVPEWGDPEQPPSGLVSGADTTAPELTALYVRGNPTYRTASGIGVGTRLDTLQRIYGEELVVDRSDGWEHPTDGLLASYQDVAAIRRAGRALTFYLRDAVVETVKVSDADFWGDDEGCA